MAFDESEIRELFDEETERSPGVAFADGLSLRRKRKRYSGSGVLFRGRNRSQVAPLPLVATCDRCLAEFGTAHALRVHQSLPGACNGHPLPPELRSRVCSRQLRQRGRSKPR
jgi:hypothetical protein